MSLWQDLRDDWRWHRTVEGGRSFWRPLREPGFWVVAVYRFGHWANRLRIPIVGQVMRALYTLCRVCAFCLTGADLRPGATIGKRFTIHTFPGIVVVNGVTIGDDCTINTGVCVVWRANNRCEGVATIGNNVRLGVGAKILGQVTIGDRVIVGANAVVLHDIPSDSIAVGLPAVAKPRQEMRNAECGMRNVE